MHHATTARQVKQRLTPLALQLAAATHLDGGDPMLIGLFGNKKFVKTDAEGKTTPESIQKLRGALEAKFGSSLTSGPKRTNALPCCGSWKTIK